MKHVNPDNYSLFTIAGHGWRANYSNFNNATRDWKKVEEEGCLFLGTRYDGEIEELDRKEAENAQKRPLKANIEKRR